jgi:hypothetical protein
VFPNLFRVLSGSSSNLDSIIAAGQCSGRNSGGWFALCALRNYLRNAIFTPNSIAFSWKHVRYAPLVQLRLWAVLLFCCCHLSMSSGPITSMLNWFDTTKYLLFSFWPAMAHVSPTLCPWTTAWALVQQGAQEQRSADECAAVPITTNLALFKISSV